MRYHITSPARPKAVARDLKTELAECGHPRSYTACLDLVSRMYGYRNWRECEALIGSVPASPEDQALDVEDATARLEQHARVLVEAGIPADLARRILWRIRPTARTKRIEVAPDHLIAGLIQTPEGVRQALHQAAIYLARIGRDIVVERYQRHVAWHIVSWTPPTPRDLLVPTGGSRRAIAIRNDGRLFEAGTTRATLAHEILKDLQETSQWNGHDDGTLSAILAEIGYPGLILQNQDLSDPVAREIAACFDHVDQEVLALLGTQVTFEAPQYEILANLSREPGRIFDRLRKTPILTGAVIDACRNWDEADRYGLYKALEQDHAPIEAEDGYQIGGHTVPHSLGHLTREIPVRIHGGLRLEDYITLANLPETHVPKSPYDLMAAIYCLQGTRLLAGHTSPLLMIGCGVASDHWAAYRMHFPAGRCESDARKVLRAIVERHLEFWPSVEDERKPDTDRDQMVDHSAWMLGKELMIAFGLPGLLRRVDRYYRERSRVYDPPLTKDEAIAKAIADETELLTEKFRGHDGRRFINLLIFNTVDPRTEQEAQESKRAFYGLGYAA